MKKIDTIVVPCRACHAAPGTRCTGAEGFHATRESDARIASELQYDREARPAATVRGRQD